MLGFEGAETPEESLALPAHQFLDHTSFFLIFGTFSRYLGLTLPPRYRHASVAPAFRCVLRWPLFL